MSLTGQHLFICTRTIIEDKKIHVLGIFTRTRGVAI